VPRPRHEPVRTCVGCREEAGKRALIRLVRGPDGAVTRDATGRAQGRGAYLHDDPACLAQARKRRAVQRALEAEVPDALWEEMTASG